jgi:hypothetical protein
VQAHGVGAVDPGIDRTPCPRPPKRWLCTSSRLQGREERLGHHVVVAGSHPASRLAHPEGREQAPYFRERYWLARSVWRTAPARLPRVSRATSTTSSSGIRFASAKPTILREPTSATVARSPSPHLCGRSAVAHGPATWLSGGEVLADEVWERHLRFAPRGTYKAPRCAGPDPELGHEPLHALVVDARNRVILSSWVMLRIVKGALVRSSDRTDLGDELRPAQGRTTLCPCSPGIVRLAGEAHGSRW